jgi:hypothetical protein
MAKNLVYKRVKQASEYIYIYIYIYDARYSFLGLVALMGYRTQFHVVC